MAASVNEGRDGWLTHSEFECKDGGLADNENEGRDGWLADSEDETKLTIFAWSVGIRVYIFTYNCRVTPP